VAVGVNRAETQDWSLSPFLLANFRRVSDLLVSFVSTGIWGTELFSLPTEKNLSRNDRFQVQGSEFKGYSLLR
jgi:hypothetical protein